MREKLEIYTGESENSKFWLSALNNIKNQGVKDIFLGIH